MDEAESSYQSSLRVVIGGGIIILIGLAVSRATGFLRQFMIIRMLTPEEYGLFATAYAWMNIMVNFSSLGVTYGARRFIAFYDAKHDYPAVKGTIRSTLKIVTASGIFLALASITLSGAISRLLSKPDFQGVFIIMCLAAPIFLLNTNIVSFFYGFRKARAAVALDDFTLSISGLLLILIALFIWRNIYAASAALAASYLVTLAAGIFLYRRIISPRLKGVAAAPMARELLAFSLPLLLTTLSSIILNNTDTMMLAYFMPADSVGFYNSAFIIMQFVSIFLFAFSTIFMPVITGMVAREEKEEIKNLYRAVSKWLFILTLPLALTFFLFPSQTLTLLFSGSYAQAAATLAILVAADFIHILLGPNTHVLVAYGNTKLLMGAWSAAAVSNVVMNLLFIPRWGISGAAIATAASLLILNLITSGFLYARYRVHPFGRANLVPMAGCFAMSALLYLPLRALVQRSNWLVLLCYPTFLLIGVLLTIITRSLTEEDILLYRLISGRLKSLR